MKKLRHERKYKNFCSPRPILISPEDQSFIIQQLLKPLLLSGMGKKQKFVLFYSKKPVYKIDHQGIGKRTGIRISKSCDSLTQCFNFGLHMKSFCP